VRAIVLCAGYGTRLGQLTSEVPKPLLDAGGRPLVELILLHLRSQGIEDVAINLHFRPEAIPERLGDGATLGLRIHYAHEERLLGTAGGAKNVEAFLAAEPELMIHYGDVVTNQDFRAMLAFHRAHDGSATVLVHRRSGSNSVVVAEEGGRVTQFLERPSEDERAGIASPLVHSGVCILDRDVLAVIPPTGEIDLPRDVFPGLVQQGRLFAYPLSGYRFAIDSATRLEDLREAVARGRLTV
jgi:NDP-sugar pyrophosphorylase family protein